MSGQVIAVDGIRVGVDVGGTFTDVASFDPRTGVLNRSKVHTTPDALVDGQVAGIRALGVDMHRIRSVLNGTTVVTNALLTHSGRPTSMIMTAGFEDVLETGRERRVGGGLHMYDLQQSGPSPLTPRFLRFPVRERIGADGRVITPLARTDVVSIARRLAVLGVDVVAVCCLFSYVNAEHERQIRDILLECDPTLNVVLSSDVAPEIREYERASTTFIDGFTRHTFGGYIEGLEAALGEICDSPALYVMQSNGGLVPADLSQVRPVHIVESGPAAGVVAAAFVANLAGYRDIIAFDVGGTTAKACLLRDGRPTMTSEFKVEGYYPINAASIDLVEIGTGGGSIAWIDVGGGLRVGPRSAGAKPGPACYGLGGSEPTVTDANLVLGRLSATTFLGGSCPLDKSVAYEAIDKKVARPLGLSVAAAAEGIIAIANSQMAAAIQLISTRKGFDPRDFVLVAYGGAGPLQAAEIAREVGVRTTLVPEGSGTLSALGLLVSDLRADAARTFMSADPVACALAVEETLADLEQVAAKRIRRPDVEVVVQRSFDVRYVGQRWELSIDASSEPFSAAVWEKVVRDFHDAHQRNYRFHDPESHVELVKLRVEARIRTPNIDMSRPTADAREQQGVVSFGHLHVNGCEMRCPVHDRGSLVPGQEFCGPSVVHDVDTTVWLPPGMSARVDRHRNILIEASK